MQGLVKLLRIIHQLILSDLQIFKIGQTGGFLGRPLEPLLKTGLPLMKTLLKTLAKSVLILLGLTAAVSATYAAIQKKKKFWIWYDNINKFELRNRWYHENN